MYGKTQISPWRPPSLGDVWFTDQPETTDQPQVSGKPDGTTAPSGGDDNVSTGDESSMMNWVVAWVAAALFLTALAGVCVYRSKGWDEE